MKLKIFTIVLTCILMSACAAKQDQAPAADSAGQSSAAAAADSVGQPSATTAADSSETAGTSASAGSEAADPLPENRGDTIDSDHNAENSLSWPGKYEGTIPGANSAIKIELTLSSDETFKLLYQYVDRGDATFEESGGFRWNDDGDIVILAGTSGSPFYRVTEGALTQLDLSGNPVTGEDAGRYILKQTSAE